MTLFKKRIKYGFHIPGKVGYDQKFACLYCKKEIKPLDNNWSPMFCDKCETLHLLFGLETINEQYGEIAMYAAKNVLEDEGVRAYIKLRDCILKSIKESERIKEKNRIEKLEAERKQIERWYGGKKNDIKRH